MNFFEEKLIVYLYFLFSIIEYNYLLIKFFLIIFVSFFNFIESCKSLMHFNLIANKISNLFLMILEKYYCEEFF